MLCYASVRTLVQWDDCMSETIHIGLSYQEGLSKQVVNEFIDDAGDSGLIVRSEERAASIYAGIEWTLHTAIAVYFLRPYFEAFLKEAGKDHYIALKRSFARLLTYLYGKNPEEREKRSSSLFAVYTVTRDGRSLKFIFPEGVKHEVYADMLEKLIVLIEEHHDHDGSDRLSSILESSSGVGGGLYVEYSVGERAWVLLDPLSEVQKIRDASRQAGGDRSDPL